MKRSAPTRALTLSYTILAVASKQLTLSHFLKSPTSFCRRRFQHLTDYQVLKCHANHSLIPDTEQLRRMGTPSRGHGPPRPWGEGGTRRRQVIRAADDAGYGGKVRKERSDWSPPVGSPQPSENPPRPWEEGGPAGDKLSAQRMTQDTVGGYGRSAATEAPREGAPSRQHTLLARPF